MQFENEPRLEIIRRERDPRHYEAPIIPYWELEPNAAEKQAIAELKDLERRVNQPIVEKHVDWRHKLEHRWRRK